MIPPWCSLLSSFSFPLFSFSLFSTHEEVVRGLFSWLRSSFCLCFDEEREREREREEQRVTANGKKKSLKKVSAAVSLLSSLSLLSLSSFFQPPLSLFFLFFQRKKRDRCAPFFVRVLGFILILKPALCTLPCTCAFLFAFSREEGGRSCKGELNKLRRCVSVLLTKVSSSRRRHWRKRKKKRRVEFSRVRVALLLFLLPWETPRYFTSIEKKEMQRTQDNDEGRSKSRLAKIDAKKRGKKVTETKNVSFAVSSPACFRCFFSLLLCIAFA